ncbi:MAG TPA: maleylpyruvate isomerase N-terminal domain-containing protein [Streptosporangiaceae bacterium]|nr:maleylpyruvate isomerase N-terminal domain-containing protein [Streptosporangiaceae bacterium]
MTSPADVLLGFDDMLALIDDRSAALRSAAAEAGMTARVPGCPDWSVHDLVAHLGEVHLFWSAAVAAGPADHPPGDDVVGDTQPHGDLLTWSADATARLVAALRAAGPGRGCWTWWASTGAPADAGAVARHQVQEAAVHAFDAQEAAGQAEPVPLRAAADGVGEYLTVELTSNGPWPHDPARLLLAAGEGGSWLIDLGPDGARPTRLAGPDAASGQVAATVTASPSDFVLTVYRRRRPEALEVTGDSRVLERMLDWPNLD